MSLFAHPSASGSHISAPEAERDFRITQLLRFLEAAIIFWLLFQFSSALVALLLYDPANPAYISPIGRLLWYPAYGFVAILLLRRLPQVIRLAVFNPLLILCILWCGLSFFWSIDPGVTLRRSVALLMTTLFGLIIAARYDWSAMVQRFAAIFALLAVLSFIMGLAFPTYGIMHEIHVGAWRGVWVEKNYMGGAMVKGFLACLCAWAMRPDRGKIWLFSAAMCFALVILSTSKTALLVALTMLGGFIGLKIYRTVPALRIPIIWGLIFVACAFALLMTLIPDEMLALIGKDRTFTGRTDIWNGLIASIKEKPWLGYGYKVYWLDEMGPSYYVRLALEWGVPSAHNGWIDTWLSAGIVSVVLFALLYIASLVLAFDRVKYGGTETYWALLSLIMFGMFTMSESTILQTNDLSWVMFVATSAKLFAFEKPIWRDKPSLPYYLRGQDRRGAG